MDGTTTTPDARAADLRCRPCRKDYAKADLANPRRCPGCGGPLVSIQQIADMGAVTEQALRDLHKSSVRMMRLTGLSMLTVEIITFFLPDRATAEFFATGVTAATAAAAVAVEVWAATASRLWMVVASIALQLAAILFFFPAIAFFGSLIRGPLVFVLASLPLAGALTAWNDFRGYNRILRLHRKQR